VRSALIRVSNAAYVGELNRYLRDEGFGPGSRYRSNTVRVFGADEDALRSSLARWPMRVLGVTAVIDEG
jgi:hypothetical protein